MIDPGPERPPYHAAMADDRPPTGTRLALPDGARPPFTVYVNGAEQHEGDDFAVEAGALRFARPLVTERRPESIFKKLVMSTAGIGFYRKADTVDLHYTDAGGAAAVASGLHVDPE
jgi:hypothetical protein